MTCSQLPIYSLQYSTNSRWHAYVFVHALTIIYILHRAEERRKEKKRKEDSRALEFIMTLFYKYLSMGKKMSLKDKVACFFLSLSLAMTYYR